MNLIMFELNGSESRCEWGIRSLILKRVKMYQNLTALCWKIRRTTAGRILIRSMCFFLNGLYLFIVIIGHILLITLCYLHYTTFVHELYFDNICESSNNSVSVRLFRQGCQGIGKQEIWKFIFPRHRKYTEFVNKYQRHVFTQGMYLEHRGKFED